MRLVVFLVVVAVISLAVFLYPRLRRRRLLDRSFPDDWKAIVKTCLPFYADMADSEREQLHRLITLFLDSKTFHGCNGLVITDEIRLTIAAEACLLLLNRRTDVYPRLYHILVYPSAFIASRPEGRPDGTFQDQSRGLLGESWQAGKVILSWEDVQKGAADARDGHNVTLHEFSHQLDSESGSANGAPPLLSSRYARWEEVLSEEFRALQHALQRHRPAVMDYYGATNPAEFFAVATETFFEKPYRMQRQHPELFAELQAYYHVDPRTWFAEQQHDD